jgi:hypothetical protein
MYKYVKEYGLDYYPQYLEGSNICAIDNKILKYKGLIPPLKLIANLKTLWFMIKINWMASKINLKRPYDSP